MQGIRYLSLLLLSLAGTSFGATKTDEGIAAFHQGRYSSAASLLRGAADEPGIAFYALSQAALGSCSAALPALTQTEHRDPLLVRLTGLAAVKCMSATADEGAAFTLLQKLQKQFPGDADVLYAAAKFHMRAFNDATLAMFQRAPASYRVHELSAEIFEQQNRFSEAVSEYQKAIALNPQAPDLHFRLGRAILLQSHDPKSLDQAAEEFRAELKVSPEDAASKFQLGQIALVRGDSAEAKRQFEGALTLAPDFISALISLGKISAREKDYASAIQSFSRAIQLQPQNETAHYALMTAYRDSGNLPAAKAEKQTLDRLQKPPEGEFSDFLKKLGEKPPAQ